MAQTQNFKNHTRLVKGFHGALFGLIALFIGGSLNYWAKAPSDNYYLASLLVLIGPIFIFFIITALLSLSGLDFTTAISAAATCISNVGPGLGEIVGPSGSFKQLPELTKWYLSFAMLLGRLEFFTVLVLFFPSFWKN